MKLNVTTTDKQDEFNTRALADANTQRASSKLVSLTLEEWYQQEFSDKANYYVDLIQGQDLAAVQSKLQAVAGQLSPQDLAEVLAVAEKYASR